MAKLLLVEDDQELSTMIELWLSGEHHTVDRVFDGDEALNYLRVYKYDAIILDWELPKVSGVEVCNQLRKNGDTTPILMLTGKKTLKEKVQGFNSGTDDYLTKPFEMEELSVRLRALLRRSAGSGQDVLKVGAVVLEPKSFRVTRDGVEVELSQLEFALLEFLMRHPNEVFSTTALLNRVWSAEVDASPDTVRQCIARLRKKIDSDTGESLIRTLHGVGYKLYTP